jgi:putative transcriptional regulator
MIEASYLNNQFLIAMPSMDDPHFSHTVTYLCQHTDDGALGIVINRPTGMKLGEIFQQMGIKTELENVLNTPVFAGGPVQQERGFVGIPASPPLTISLSPAPKMYWKPSPKAKARKTI